MWELFGAAGFDRAYHSSESYRKAMELRTESVAAQFPLAQGLLVAIVVVTPFWLSFALLIHHLSH